MNQWTGPLAALTAIALALACQLDTEDAYNDYLELGDEDQSDDPDLDDGDEDSSTTGSDYEPIETSTSGPSSPPMEEPPPGGPAILEFSVTPPLLHEAGPVSLQVEHTPDVESVILFDIYDGETRLLAELGPNEPWTYAITSEADFAGLHELHAIVIDEHDRWAESEAELIVDLPPAGSAIWINEGEGDESPLSFALAVAAVDTGVVLAGTDYNAGSDHAFARLYDGHTSELSWTYKAPKGVYISDVEADPSGGVVLVGHVDVDDTMKAWVHHLDLSGAPSWPSPIDWLENTAATAVAVDQYGGIYAAGEATQLGMFEHTDIFVWHIPAEGQGMPTWATWGSNIAPTPIDRASSIALTNDQRVLIGGSTTASTGNNFVERMAVLEYRDVEILQRWVASGESTEESRGLEISALENDIVVAGWRRLSLNDPPTSFGVRLHEASPNTTLETVWEFPSGYDFPGQVFGVDQDPNGRVVMLETFFGSPDGLRAIALHPNGLPAWSAEYKHLGNGDTAARGLSIDQYGYVYFAGTLANDGKFHTLLGKLRP